MKRQQMIDKKLRKKLKKKAQKEHREATRNERLKLKLRKRQTAKARDELSKKVKRLEEFDGDEDLECKKIQFITI
jgi:hypothetical protein